MNNEKTVSPMLAAALLALFVISTAPALNANPQDSSHDIVDTLVSMRHFKTLAAAVEAAGLVETLKGEGPFTVLAPSDEAFGRLPDGAVAELLKPENLGKLRTILAYHVVPGTILLRRQSPESVEGTRVTFMAAGPTLVNGAEIVLSDIRASNGIIHVIDTVLMPGTEEESERQAAEKLILLAIDRGVPLFNAGEAEECVTIYAQAARNLMSLSPQALNESDRHRLESAMLEMHASHNSRERAWIMRRALDATLLSMLMPGVEAASAESAAFLIDDFARDDLESTFGTQWRLLTDRVMGGVSDATASYEEIDGSRCLRMRGNVSLENNGGFIQVALTLQDGGGPFDAGPYKGVRIRARGNGDEYYIHLRTSRSRLPWQYYSAPFTAGDSWRQIDIPFESFAPQNLSSALDPSELVRIAVVGAKKAFAADVAVARIEFYR